MQFDITSGSRQQQRPAQRSRPRRPAPFFTRRSLRAICPMSLALAAIVSGGNAAHAGTWTPLTNTAPSGINLMMLLSDGTVMAQAGGATNNWYKLTPNNRGSYVSGTWTTLANMHDTRLYGMSQVLPDGRVFIGGGEYGTGTATAEVYDPLANTWTMTPSAGQTFSDAISATLPGGNVLVSPVGPSTAGGTVIYNPSNNTWSAGPNLFRGYYQDEASWVKLPDGSILTVDPFGTNSERYIPSQNRWIDDGIVPVSLYDADHGELGAALLLPNGKAFFLGGTGHTAFYTPSGNTNPGTWTPGPDMPAGLGTSDAPAAVEANGLVLCAMGPVDSLNGPTNFYEFNPANNTFTAVSQPTGSQEGGAPFGLRMLDLPDGGVLYSNGGSRLYEYTPAGAQTPGAQPTIANILKNADGSYSLTGYQLTGISEGAGYGDDAQMSTNYPIVRITDASGNVYYARTYNWSSTFVAQGGTLQSTQFKVPAGLPTGTLTLQVVANGIASYSVPFGTSSIYSYVANENQTVNFTAPADAAFGAIGSFFYRYAQKGSFTFSNTTFGGDPIFGVVKSGYSKPFTQSAPEGSSATFTQPIEAAYGANGAYFFNWGTSGTVTFTNAAWGGDPIPNVAKSGYYMSYTYCAPENGTVTFTTPIDLAYGANGHYAFRHAFTGTVTFNNTTFGDPISGTVKAGYYRPSH